MIYIKKIFHDSSLRDMYVPKTNNGPLLQPPTPSYPHTIAKMFTIVLENASEGIRE
jgi:hypothetical protein